MSEKKIPDDAVDAAVPPAPSAGDTVPGSAGDITLDKPVGGPAAKPPPSRERLQQARRRVLRTIHLTRRVNGAPLSG